MHDTVASLVAAGHLPAKAAGRLVPPYGATESLAEHYRTIVRPFDWTSTRNDLNQVLAKIADREPDLRLAA